MTYKAPPLTFFHKLQYMIYRKYLQNKINVIQKDCTAMQSDQQYNQKTQK